MADLARLRERMVKEQIESRGIDDPRLLTAFRKVERHLFVPDSEIAYAYDDRPVPIGDGQTISQPYIVALMLDLLKLEGKERTLDVGAGSGYQTALIAELARDVYAIERIQNLYLGLEDRFATLGYNRIQLRWGDGSLGWSEASPFDRIIIGAATPTIPQSLLNQLAIGGRMVLPVGGRLTQELYLVEKEEADAVRVTRHGGCLFVPLLGKEGWT